MDIFKVVEMVVAHQQKIKYIPQSRHVVEYLDTSIFVFHALSREIGKTKKTHGMHSSSRLQIGRYATVWRNDGPKTKLTYCDVSVRMRESKKRCMQWQSIWKTWLTTKNDEVVKNNFQVGKLDVVHSQRVKVTNLAVKDFLMFRQAILNIVLQGRHQSEQATKAAVTLKGQQWREQQQQRINHKRIRLLAENKKNYGRFCIDLAIVQ